MSDDISTQISIDFIGYKRVTLSVEAYECNCLDFGAIGSVLDLFPIKSNADYDGINYELQLQLLSANLLLDYYPWGPDSTFRLTVGMMYQNIRFDGVAEAQGTVEIGENAYDLSDLGQLSGSVFFQNEFAPYVGIGIGNPNNAVRNRVSFFGELGLLFVGDIDASLTATNPSPGTDLNQLANDLSLEAGLIRRQVNRDWSLPFWPVLNLGFTYTF